MNGQAAFVDAKGDIYSCSSLVGNKKYFIGNVYTGIEENLLKEVKERIRQAMSFCKFCKDFKTAVEDVLLVGMLMKKNKNMSANAI